MLGILQYFHFILFIDNDPMNDYLTHINPSLQSTVLWVAQQYNDPFTTVLLGCFCGIAVVIFLLGWLKSLQLAEKQDELNKKLDDLQKK